MATALSNYDNSDRLKLTISGQRITDHLRLYYLPDEACDFVVDGAHAYLVEFENPEVFGIRFAMLQPGNNVFVPLTDAATGARFYPEVQLSKELHGKNVETGPIVIPPTPHPHVVGGGGLGGG